jgi:hypothetical protein
MPDAPTIEKRTNRKKRTSRGERTVRAATSAEGSPPSCTPTNAISSRLRLIRILAFVDTAEREDPLVEPDAAGAERASLEDPSNPLRGTDVRDFAGHRRITA